MTCLKNLNVSGTFLINCHQNLCLSVIILDTTVITRISERATLWGGVKRVDLSFCVFPLFCSLWGSQDIQLLGEKQHEKCHCHILFSAVFEMSRGSRATPPALPKKKTCRTYLATHCQRPCKPAVPLNLGALRAYRGVLVGLRTQTQNAASFERKGPKRKPWPRGKSLNRKK